VVHLQPASTASAVKAPDRSAAAERSHPAAARPPQRTARPQGGGHTAGLQHRAALRHLSFRRNPPLSPGRRRGGTLAADATSGPVAQLVSDHGPRQTVRRRDPRNHRPVGRGQRGLRGHLCTGSRQCGQPGCIERRGRNGAH